MKSDRHIQQIRVFLLAEALVFVVAALVHARTLLEGYEHDKAEIAESVLAAVLFIGFLIAWKRSAWTRIAGIMTQGFAFFGTLIGLFTIVVGLGPQSTLDVVYHLAMIAVLLWGLIAFIKTPGRDGRTAELNATVGDGSRTWLSERQTRQSFLIHPYVLAWITVALLLGGLLAFADYRRNPLNDPDQARQRTGVLLPTAQEPAPRIPALNIAGRPVVIIFDRTLAGRHLFHDLADQSDLTRNAELLVVTSDGSRPVVETGIDHMLADQDESIARAFDLRKPVDGGYPVGYVLVDSSGFIRFRTLDPGYDKRAWEIVLLLGEM